MFTNKKKIALVGTGMVGMSFAYAALNQNLCDELVLIDINEQRARGEAMDLNHGIHANYVVLANFLTQLTQNGLSIEKMELVSDAGQIKLSASVK